MGPKKKIYISGPIKADPETAFKRFAEAEQMLNKAGYEAVNPMTLPHDHDKSYQAYMREDLKALLECDGIYMLDNWSVSVGARLESEVAIMCGIKVIYQNHKLPIEL